MQATRWADDIRAQDKAQNRPPWHFSNFPFKPEGQPPSVQTKDPEAVNILTAMAENERTVRSGTDPERRQSLSRGSFTLWATYISHYTRPSYSLLITPKVTGAETKSVCE